MWNKMAQEIWKVPKETMENQKVFGLSGKESWWWNERFLSKDRVKKDCFKEWFRCKISKLKKKYKNEIKKMVSEARIQDFD